MMESEPKEVEGSQNNRWSRMELSTDGVTSLNVNGVIPICSSDLFFKSLSVSP